MQEKSRAHLSPDPDRADKLGMDGRQHELFISDALHKAFFEMNEARAEAAAAAAKVVRSRSAPVPVPTFRADHPFLVMIRGQLCGSILLLGRLENLGAL